MVRHDFSLGNLLSRLSDQILLWAASQITSWLVEVVLDSAVALWVHEHLRLAAGLHSVPLGRLLRLLLPVVVVRSGVILLAEQVRLSGRPGRRSCIARLVARSYSRVVLDHGFDFVGGALSVTRVTGTAIAVAVSALRLVDVERSGMLVRDVQITTGGVLVLLLLPVQAARD